MITLSKSQMDAGQAFANAAVAALQDGGKMHAGTVVGGSARMAGTYLFRSFGLELREVKPGDAVLSEPANAQGPVLIQIAAGILDRLGIKLDSAADANDARARFRADQGPVRLVDAGGRASRRGGHSLADPPLRQGA
jgi:hypothetical protein